MPGFFGVVQAPQRTGASSDRELVELVERMSAAMQYEPLYSADIFSCPELGACVARVGWPCGHSPRGARNGPAPFVLVTTGEPIWESSLDTGSLKDGSAQWSGPGARDVALAYSRFGEDGLGQLNGIFAGFLMDRRRATCHLFNDRYGIERLFLYQEGARTFFSSEAKAILAVAPATRTFDPEGLAQFLACGCTLDSRSLYSGIEALEGGTLLSFPAGALPRRRAYFDRSALE